MITKSLGDDFPERKLDIFHGQSLSENFPPGSIHRVIEDITLRGFTVLPSLYDFDCDLVRDEIDKEYEKEKANWPLSTLRKINDVGVVRNPFLRNRVVFELVFSKEILQLLKAVFGFRPILHVNRFVISDPEDNHPASVWHREPPYNNFIAQGPSSLSLVYLPDGSNCDNSGLCLLPASHRWQDFPSDDYALSNELYPDVEPGKILMFDSNLLHRGGRGGTELRRSMVSIFTTPTIKQQTNIAQMVKRSHPELLGCDEEVLWALGLPTDPKMTDDEYRKSKL